MKVYEVKIIYVSEDTIHVEADSKENAVEAAFGSGAFLDQRVTRHYAPRARVIKGCINTYSHPHEVVT